MTKLSLPPGNLGLPFLGETLAFLRDPTAFTDERQARYGRVYKTSLFGRPTIMGEGGKGPGGVYDHGTRDIRTAQ